MQNRCITVRELVEEVWISTGSVHSIFTDDLAVRRVWQLHHDNAPARSSQLIQTFLAKPNIPVVQQTSICKEAFQKCFEQWRNRWEECVLSQGDFFEGD
jgi:hypothetical protein